MTNERQGGPSRGEPGANPESLTAFLHFAVHGLVLQVPHALNGGWTTLRRPGLGSDLLPQPALLAPVERGGNGPDVPFADGVAARQRTLGKTNDREDS